MKTFKTLSKMTTVKRAGIVLVAMFVLNTAFVNLTIYTNQSEAFIVVTDSTGLIQNFPTINVTQTHIRITNAEGDNTTITKLYSTSEGGTTYTFTPGEYDIAIGEYGHLIGGEFVEGNRNVRTYVEYN